MSASRILLHPAMTVRNSREEKKDASTIRTSHARHAELSAAITLASDGVRKIQTLWQIGQVCQPTARSLPPCGPTACPILLPLLDELRTYCYEHRIEEIPALLVG